MRLVVAALIYLAQHAYGESMVCAAFENQGGYNQRHHKRQ